MKKPIIMNRYAPGKFNKKLGIMEGGELLGTYEYTPQGVDPATQLLGEMDSQGLKPMADDDQDAPRAD